MSLNITQNGQKLIVDTSGNLLVNVAAGGGGGTQYADGVTQATPTGTAALGKNPTNILHTLSLDASGNLNVNLAAGTISGGNAAASPTGAAVPASADYLGGKDGSGNLIGLLVEATANPNLRVGIYSGANEVTVTGANALKVDNSGVTQPENLAQVGGSALALGQALMASSIPVVISSNQSTLVVQELADGLTATTVPSRALLIGFQDGAGLLRAPSVDGQGNLNISPNGISEQLQLLLLETRAMRHAMMAFVCDGAKFNPADFNPASFQTEVISESILN